MVIKIEQFPADFSTDSIRFKATERLETMEVSDDFARVLAGRPPTGSRDGTRYKFQDGKVVREDRTLVAIVRFKDGK